MQVTTVGLDLAKRVFQVHGVDAGGRVVMRRKLQPAEVQPYSLIYRSQVNCDIIGLGRLPFQMPEAMDQETGTS